MAQLHQKNIPSLPPDRYAGDPFFKRHPNSTWNACIGVQGDEEYYLDGYIEAAIELAAAVIDKGMFGKRDTLVLPILYNARHAVELVLKLTTVRLVDAGLIPPIGRPNHDINGYWERLSVAAVGDEKLNKQILALKPFVDSLSRIDNDGQELRYHLNRFDDPSLEDYSLANLEVIRASLSELSKIISILKNRVICFTDERRSGLFTRRCSRRDLLTIAQIIPRRESWNNALFDNQKAVVKARFNLTNGEFSKALNAIQASRETKAIIGVETDLLHISDDEIVWFIEQWRRIHPPRGEAGHAFSSEAYDEAWLEDMKKKTATLNEIFSEIEVRINGDKLAEVEAMFYLGRDGLFPEYYEAFVEKKKREHAVENDAKSEVAHLMGKTNFLHSVHIAARKLGRLSLATRLATLLGAEN
jgi:5S rRNA maturation endonuclease (ribonuclease M5)